MVLKCCLHISEATRVESETSPDVVCHGLRLPLCTDNSTPLCEAQITL